MTVADLLLKTVTLTYHPNVMATSGVLVNGVAPAGADAVAVAQAARNAKGYILVVEGAIPVTTPAPAISGRA